MIGWIIAGVVLLVIVIWAIATSNKLNKAIVKVDEATSDIDVALTKRYDVLVKMMDTVKGYAKHEQETLFGVVNLRKGMSVQEMNDANRVMSENLGKINVLVEQYPELKANETFVNLQKSITDVEEHLQASRRVFNANVSYYNQLIVTFPVSLIAGMKHLTKKDFFVADEAKRADVKIEF